MLVVAALLAGCSTVEPEDDADVDLDRPDSVSDVLAAFWLDWEAEDVTRLGALAVAMTEQLDAEALAEAHITGGQRPLTREQQQVVDLYAPPDDDGSWSLPNPADATPVFLANRYTCGLDALERILIHLDQDALYDSYDAYDRRYTSDAAAYRAGEVNTISWEVDLTASGFGLGSYEEKLLGGVRRLPIPDDVEGDFPVREFLLARTWIPYPAKGEAIDFRQDYQLEIYVPWGTGDILHLYGIWRELETGFGKFSEPLVQSVTLNNLKGWDDTTERHCAEGRP